MGEQLRSFEEKAVMEEGSGAKDAARVGRQGGLGGGGSNRTRPPADVPFFTSSSPDAGDADEDEGAKVHSATDFVSASEKINSGASFGAELKRRGGWWRGGERS